MYFPRLCVDLLHLIIAAGAHAQTLAGGSFCGSYELLYIKALHTCSLVRLYKIITIMISNGYSHMEC